MFFRTFALALLTVATLLDGAGTSFAESKPKTESKAKKEEAPVAEPPVVEEKPTPYDDRLLRLAEILGSVHYLRNLCNGREAEWRQMMTDLLAEETRNEPKRAAVLTAGFNRGYRSFAATYTKCTPQAVAAEEKYRAEGATLATEITARFGN
jgi:uncharacterized protein (TIGR02301 family)